MPIGERFPAAVASKFQRLQVRPPPESRLPLCLAAEAARGGWRAAPARSAYVWSLSGCASCGSGAPEHGIYRLEASHHRQLRTT
jgi:hypothetical protein